jgi:hypothetical protein
MNGPVFPKVTRVEVIDASGRAFVGRYEDAGAFIDLQDDGWTLKVFVGRLAGGGDD